MQTHSSEPLNKRLVFVTGDKGGVGKSFMARTLVQHNLDTNQTCHAYDIDPVNPSLHQYYPENTIQLDLEESGGRTTMADRSRVRGYLDQVYAQLETVKEQLSV